MENNIYLIIPNRFKNVYNKLLRALADTGSSILKECNSIKSNNSNSIISCWNMFQSAIACNELNRIKEADLFVEYIDKQLDIIYRNANINVEKVDGYRIFIGAHPSEILDFDITNVNYFTEFYVGNNIVGEYNIYNNTYGNYAWICIPNIFGDIVVTNELNMEIPLLEPVLKTINIDNSSIDYKCYRVENAIVDGTHKFIINMK